MLYALCPMQRRISAYQRYEVRVHLRAIPRIRRISGLLGKRTKIAIIGAGGHGKVVLDAVLSGGVHIVAGIVDDNVELVGTRLFDVPIVGSIENLNDVDGYVIAIGDNRIRREKYNFYLQAGYTPVTVIHPSAIISPSARIGKGTVVFANVVVNPDADIGDNVVLCTSCTIDHECSISHHSYISPGCNICGRVRVGAGTMLGAGAVVLPGLSIGEWSTVRAGAVVAVDLPDKVTAVGVPARIIGEDARRKTQDGAEPDSRGGRR